MAYVAEITKQSVVKISEKDYQITIDVQVTDDSIPEVVFTQSFSKRYNSDWTIADINSALQNKIKAAWDKYIAEQDIYDATAFDNVVSSLQTAMNTYMNA